MVNWLVSGSVDSEIQFLFGGLGAQRLQLGTLLRSAVAGTALAPSAARRRNYRRQIVLDSKARFIA